MPGPIDDALKHLTELSPQDWVVRGGWPATAAALIDADIGTISGAADKVIRVSSTPDWLLAIDFQSGHDSLAKLPDLLLLGQWPNSLGNEIRQGKGREIKG